MSDNKEIKLATEIAQAVMADPRVQKGIDVAAGVVTISNEAVDAALEHAGVEAKELRRVQKAVTEASLGLIEAAAEKAVDSFHKHKELASANGNFKMGHEEYSFDIERESELSNPFNKDAATKKVWANTTIRRKSTVGSSTIKATKERISALGIKKLGN